MRGKAAFLTTTAAAIALLAGVALMPARGADSQPAPAPLMLPATAGWLAFTTPMTNPDDWLPDDYLHGRASIEAGDLAGRAAG